MRAPGAAESPWITSITSTSNLEMAVPRITDSPSHFIPERTSPRRMIGSAARAAGAAERDRIRQAASANRCRTRANLPSSGRKFA